VHCTRQRIGYGRAIRASHKKTFGVQTVALPKQHLNHLNGISIISAAPPYLGVASGLLIFGLELVAFFLFFFNLLLDFCT